MGIRGAGTACLAFGDGGPRLWAAARHSALARVAAALVRTWHTGATRGACRRRDSCRGAAVDRNQEQRGPDPGGEQGRVVTSDGAVLRLGALYAARSALPGDRDGVPAATLRLLRQQEVKTQMHADQQDARRSPPNRHWLTSNPVAGRALHPSAFIPAYRVRLPFPFLLPRWSYCVAHFARGRSPRLPCRESNRVPDAPCDRVAVGPHHATAVSGQSNRAMNALPATPLLWQPESFSSVQRPVPVRGLLGRPSFSVRRLHA